MGCNLRLWSFSKSTFSLIRLQFKRSPLPQLADAHLCITAEGHCPDILHLGDPATRTRQMLKIDCLNAVLITRLSALVHYDHFCNNLAWRRTTGMPTTQALNRYDGKTITTVSTPAGVVRGCVYSTSAREQRANGRLTGWPMVG